MQAAGCGDYQLQSGGGAEDVESRRASVARQGVYADVVGATSAHSVAGEQGSTQAIPNRLVRAGVAIQGAHPALAAGRLVQSQHRNETEGGLPAPVGMGTACAGTGHARDQTDRVRVAGVGDQEQGSTCRCVERRCTTDHRRASRPASDLCVYLGEPEGPKASVLSSEQLRLEGSPAACRSPLPEGAGSACAGRLQASEGARPQAHVRTSIAGSGGEPGGPSGHPGPQDRPHHDPLQCPGNRKPGRGSEPDSKLTRNSRENRSTVGRVTCKSLKIFGGKGGTRTLDPGIMRKETAEKGT